MPAIIYDFKAIGGALRKQRIDDWWQPEKDESATGLQKVAGRIAANLDAWHDPFGQVYWPRNY